MPGLCIKKKMYKIGLGLDSHKIKPRKLKNNKSLVLGGVEVSKDFYVAADSDGDVIIHSLCNAFSTALGGGSIDTWAGPLFKKGITDSREYLKIILKKVKNGGFEIGNVAIMVEAGRPRLEKFRKKIQGSLVGLLGIEKENIGLAFTTGENLTAFGEGKGIQVFSTVLLQK